MRVPGKPRRIEIDFVRGCAILGVMMLHFRVPHTGIMVLDDFKGFFLHVGGHGVTLFFVLSGFLVGGLLMKEYRDTQNIRAGRFLLRRMFKIWPAYYFLLLFHLVTHHHPWRTFLWQNALHVQNYYGTSILQTWSLAVEEHFYVMLPLLVAYMAARRWSAWRMLIVFAAVSAVSFLWRLYAIRRLDYDAVQHQTQYNIDSLLFGVSIAVLFYFLPDVYTALSRRAWPLLAIVLAGMLLTRLPNQPWSVPFNNFMSYFACGAFLLFFMEHSGRWVDTWPYRTVSTIGIYSYGLYLYHSLMLTVGEHIVARYRPLPGYFMAWTAQLGGALILGYVMTRIVEWPFLLWRERIPTLRDQKPLMAQPNEGDAEGLVQTVGPAQAMTPLGS